MEQNNITTRQNEQSFIDRLAAQRHLYSKAKKLSSLLFVLCVLGPVLLAVGKVSFPQLTWLPVAIVVYSYVATLLRIWLRDMATKRKTLAARIQQLFDSELFNLTWNKPLCGAKPNPEEIHAATKGADYDRLDNWYEAIVSELPLSVGALVCMRTNVVYDQSLRKSYSTVCYATTFLAILVVLGFGIWNNTRMWDAFLYGIVPLMPLVTWGIDLYKQHQANIRALNNIEALIEGGLQQAGQTQQVDKHLLEEIQNFIFLHRKSSYLIPDSFYIIVRKRHEEAAHYGAEEICRRYNLI